MSKQVKKPGTIHLPKCKSCPRPVDDGRRDECGACAAGKGPSYCKKKTVNHLIQHEQYWETGFE